MVLKMDKRYFGGAHKDPTRTTFKLAEANDAQNIEYIMPEERIGIFA
jgi:hypothetical protein